MSTGDGLAVIGAAVASVGVTWAACWATVRSMAIRAEALRRLGDGAWQTKTTTTKRARA